MADTTPTLREAAQQALEALAPLANATTPAEREALTDADAQAADAASCDLRAALAEQAAEQAEPVAWSPRLTYPGYEAQRVWANGKPRQEEIDYWQKQGLGIDLAFAAPPAPAPTWPEWAEQILKTVREYSGYDGYDDADGVDLPEEVREALEELTAQITRLEAKAPAPAADAMPAGWRDVIADVAADISDHPSLAHEKLRRLLASAPAPARQPAAWMHPDGRVVPAATMEAAERDGGAMRSSLAAYTIPLAPITAAPAEGGAA